MKKLTIILCTILLAVMTAQAQISFYGEWCRKGSGKLWIAKYGLRPTIPVWNIMEKRKKNLLLYST